ncbi:MAG TPA: hypothetical protein VL443_05100 [Cyclobacteriaceae bacterium]|jgi:hypothetical protein|nr:hypothetical protein [Cyclobacteriaceae bacterium]
MKLKKLNVQLLKLPSDIEFVLFLIKEELKSNRLLNSLTKIGFDDSHHRSDFSTMILATLGFEERTDELYEFYFRLLDDYCKKIEADNKKIVKAAFNLYVDLTIEKRKRLTKN